MYCVHSISQALMLYKHQVFVSRNNFEAKHENEDKCPKSQYDVDTQGVCLENLS